jgi:hypothetical protein
MIYLIQRHIMQIAYDDHSEGGRLGEGCPCVPNKTYASADIRDSVMEGKRFENAEN